MAIVEMIGIVKHFGAVLANDEVDFTLQKGEIHALLGENGAGKSTLMNILVGMYHPDAGEIRIRGKKYVIESPRVAESLGIGMVHQHFMLIPTLTVAENIVLGLKTSRSPFLGLTDAKDRIQELSEQYQIRVDPDAYISELSVGEQQRVEILKQLYRGAAILILDEPTAVLTPQETESLFKVLRNMVDEGHSIVLITHKLDEALTWCEQIDVLRDGRLAGSVTPEDVNRSELARMMVGREVLFQYSKPKSEQTTDPVLAAENVSVRGIGGQVSLSNVSLQIHAGEIVGVAGVAGNGQSELAKVFAGLKKVEQGRITLIGSDITHCSIDDIIRKKLSYIPGDRHRTAMLPNMSIAANMVLKQHNRAPFAHRSVLNPDTIRQHSETLVKNYDVRTPSVNLPMDSLSGGNQQKVVLARELELKPHVLIADQPTRGLDIGAIEYIHNILLEARSKGVGILLISTELDEIMKLSDRIVVMFEGQIIYEDDAAHADIEKLGLAMAGENVTL